QQLYYLLLLAMCKKVEFPQGIVRLQEFIDEQWLSCLPKETFATGPATGPQKPVMEFDLLGRRTGWIDQQEFRARKPIPIIGEGTRPAPRSAERTPVSKADLEKQLDAVLQLYR